MPDKDHNDINPSVTPVASNAFGTTSPTPDPQVTSTSVQPSTATIGQNTEPETTLPSTEPLQTSPPPTVIPPPPVTDSQQSPHQKTQLQGDNTQQPSESIATPPDGVPPVVSTGGNKGGLLRQFGNKKIATVLGLLLIVGGVSAGVLLVGQQQDIREEAASPEDTHALCELQPSSDIKVYYFSGDWIASTTEGNGWITELDPVDASVDPVNPGQYKVTLQSFDRAHPDNKDQPCERWYAELNNLSGIVTETSAISDLSDNENVKIEIVNENLEIAGRVTKIIAKHADAPPLGSCMVSNANSINPICIAFERLDENLDICEEASADKSTLTPGESVILSSSVVSSETADIFWFAVYNKDNLDGSNIPKPVCTSSSAGNQTWTENCPNGTHVLGFKVSDPGTTSASITVPYEEIFIEDENNNNQIVERVTVNAYMQKEGKDRSPAVERCAVSISSEDAPDCDSVKAYEVVENVWSDELNEDDLSNLVAGDEVYFTVKGISDDPENDFTAAIFIINGVAGAETTDIKPGSPGEFYYKYIIPEEEFHFLIEASVKYKDGTWI